MVDSIVITNLPNNEKLNIEKLNIEKLNSEKTK